jgi:RNA polymerase sigma-70 factor (ECF subfamily)
VDTDPEHVRRLLRGDEAAFEQFFDAAYPALYRFALARLDFDHDAAGEVAQAALCKAIRKLHTFRGEASLLTWLCTFCRRELYEHRQRHRGWVQVDLLEDTPEIRAALESLRAAAPQDLDASLDRTRVASLVQRVLDQLPTHYAHALEWKYIEELPVRDIGERMGLGLKAAESLLTRARQAFREAFQMMAPERPGRE